MVKVSQKHNLLNEGDNLIPLSTKISPNDDILHDTTAYDKIKSDLAIFRNKLFEEIKGSNL